MGKTKEKTHVLKPSDGKWEAGTSDRNVEEVVTLIKGFDVPTINRGAKAYKDAQAVLEEAKEAIRTEAVKLEEVWGGEASVEAQTALGILYVTMGRLAEKLSEMSTPLETLAEVVSGHQGFINGDHSKGLFSMKEWSFQTNTWDDDIPSVGFKVYNGALGPKADTSEFDWWESQNGLAGKHLQVLSNDLAVVHDCIPKELQKSLRDIKPPAEPQIDPTPVRYPTGSTGGTNFSSVPYDGAGLNGSGSNGGPPFGTLRPDTGVTDPRGVDPTTGYPPGTSGTDPNALNPPGTDVPGGATPVGQPPSPDTSIPSADTAGLNRNPSPTGPDTSTRLADYTPNTPTYSPTATTPTSSMPGYAVPTSSSTPTTGTYGGTGTGGGVIPGQATSLSTRAGTGVGGGMPFLPMSGAGGAGGGGESKDRESTTWLHEDDDVWGDDTGSVSSRIG